MSRWAKFFIATFSLLLAACWGFYQQNYLSYGHWNTVNHGSPIRWMRFYWLSAEIGNKKRSKAIMVVPVTLQDIPDTFICQFDIGRDLTTIDGNTLKKCIPHSSALNSCFHKPFLMNIRQYISPLQMAIDGAIFTTGKALVENMQGAVNTSDSSIRYRDIGVIGIDVCKDKILIIDYPNQRFAITDSVPAGYCHTYCNFIPDRNGEPILPLTYKGKQFSVLFDCGSSIFPLLVNKKKAVDFSLSAIDDSFSIAESRLGGRIAHISGRHMADSITLAGRKYGNIEVYTSENEGVENASGEYDAITGNALFFDNIIVVDFRNKRFSVL